MTLGDELSLGGAAVHFLVALGIWAAGVLVGGALLARLGGRASRLETLALAGPWGLVFIAGVLAAIGSRGTSMLTPLPVLQLVLTAVLYRSARRNSDKAGSGSEAESRTEPLRARRVASSYGMLIAGFLGLLLLAQLVHRAAVMPYAGSGQWSLPHKDYCSRALRAERLAHNGAESLSAVAILSYSDQGRPERHLYHYVELWLTGYIAGWSGLNPLTVLLFVVYPLLVAMIAFGAAAITFILLPTKPWSAAAGAAAIFVTPLVSWVGGRYGFDIPPAWMSISLLAYSNNYVGITLAISGLMHVFRGRPTAGATALACSTAAAQPLLALLIPGLLPLGLWGLVRYLRSKGGLDALYLAGSTIVLALGLFLWTKLTGHTTSPLLETYQMSVLRFVWITFIVGILALAGSVLGLPFFLGLWRLWNAEPSDPNQGSSRTVVALCLSVWALSFFLYGALGGGDSNAIHVLYVMWVGFLIPVGWAGLCVMLAKGPWKGLAAGGMFTVLVFGVASTAEYYRSGPGPERFGPDEIDELRRTCQGRAVGYFADERSEDEESWWSGTKGWDVLGGFSLLRLNQIEEDGSGYRQPTWQKAAPAAYARSLGKDWSNDPAIILGFMRSHGIQIVMEWPKHPIPEDISARLILLQQVGPFSLYGVSQLPDSPDGPAGRGAGNPGRRESHEPTPPE